MNNAINIMPLQKGTSNNTGSFFRIHDRKKNIEADSFQLEKEQKNILNDLKWDEYGNLLDQCK